eukprot:3004629-Prymnesium_polylepis.1
MGLSVIQSDGSTFTEPNDLRSSWSHGGACKVETVELQVELGQRTLRAIPRTPRRDGDPRRVNSG